LSILPVGPDGEAMVRLGKVVISRRERIVMLEPFDKGLMATALRYGYEIRDAKPYFEAPGPFLPDRLRTTKSHALMLHMRFSPLSPPLSILAGRKTKLIPPTH
jgi:non-homologous end joining protein Ku